MLSNTEIIEINSLFILIDHGVIRLTKQSIEWLKNKSIEQYALLNWLLTRWVFIRKHIYHLP